jgi:VIT1/CCC1 family predicted Fe2+/Mn2+ transporter
LSGSGVDSWRHEKESAWLYRIVAEVERDPGNAKLFLKLAAAAEDQADKWQATHPQSVSFQPSTRGKIVARLVRALGPRRLRPVLAAMKLRGLSVYTSARSAGHAMPTSVTQVGESHRSTGNGNFRAAVFGVNDGLVSNAALVFGVAAAGANTEYVTLTGVAGLLAGALSMASGEYISVRSQREMYEYQIELEREELAEYPEEEAEELALIYNARGMDLDRARVVATELLSNPEHALDVLSREELGLNPDELGSPWGAALASFGSFAVGALLPLLPFLLRMPHGTALTATVAITAAALFAVGMLMSLFSGRNAWGNGLRMVLIGGGAGLLAYTVGRMLGVALA